MAFVNHATKEINCKIVYYGAGMGGKTTNVQYIYAQTSPMVKGKLITLPLEKERTIYFDFLPLVVGEIRGFSTRFHLYSVPGQVFYDAPRKAILSGVDGVVFVVDSRKDRMDANLESWENLRINLEMMGKSRDRMPMVLQYNKRDIRDPIPLEELERIFNPNQLPYFEAVAKSGGGVFDTLKSIGKVVLRSLKETGI